MSRAIPSVLAKIAERTRAVVAAEKQALGSAQLQRLAEQAPACRDFARALAGPGLHVIAEIKRASPSEGPIAMDLDPVDVARGYLGAGARALSILTETEWFKGELAFIPRVRAAFPDALILRKDFFLDEYQLLQARAAGADAILLIVAMLERPELEALYSRALALGLSPLVEVHDEEEMAAARGLGARLVGINNRNLRTLEVSLETSERLLPLAQPGTTLVAESGLSRPEDLVRLRAMGFSAFLIGSSLMKTGRPGEALGRLLKGAGA